VITLFALAAALAAHPAVADTFPHARHAHLFTNCTACHAGILTGDTATMLPTPATCAPCHDGDFQRRVDWTPSPPKPTNLHFDHRAHAERIEGQGDPELPCMRCHAMSDTAEFMDIASAQPARCITCHEHRATAHLVDARCTQCHVPLPLATGLTAQDIAQFPTPPSHDSGFALHHDSLAGAPGAMCATCHAREFCASCHVNAARVPVIQALGTDARVAELARAQRLPYPTPPSHAGPGFIREHGAMARADRGATCSNCHARSSCLTCHREEERVPVVGLLPERRRGGAAGVDLTGIQPPDHTPDFARHHRAVAAAGDASCTHCHTGAFCASCHDAASAPGFHPPDFVQRHAQAAYNSESECAVCHQTEAFCRDCHVSVGRSRMGPTAANYHDNQPLWLFGHGAVARRSIETCASCHQQNFCLQCHSASGGQRVNPHGPGFDAATMEKKNPSLCLVCHVGGPPQ